MKKNEYSLKDIIDGCKRDNDLFKKLLYEGNYGYVSAVVFRYIRDRDDVQELVNDCFLKIFRKINQFTFPDQCDDYWKTFRSWIGRIAVNTALDRIRVKKLTIYVEDLSISQINNFSAVSSDELSVLEILSLLDRLPELPRVIFNLYEIEGFSHKEIANMLNIPEGSSRVYLGRAKQLLKTFIHHLNSAT